MFLLCLSRCLNVVPCQHGLTLTGDESVTYMLLSSSSRMHVINHNWSAMKQRPHPQSVAEISRHSIL